MSDCNEVISFWFEELQPSDWFAKSDELDATIKERFETLVISARLGELYSWRAHPEGRLAEIILIDQFSRNIFRDSPEAFSADAVALVLAQEAIAVKADEALSAVQRAFLYMPFMHSESKAIHKEAMLLFSQPGLEHNLEFEIRHKEIIDRFGRYPHRNAVLGRQSTKEELEFLKQPNSGF